MTMRQKRTDPIKDEIEPEEELTEEEPVQQSQEAEKAEPSVEPAAEEDSQQHISETGELTKEYVDRLAEEKGIEEALAELEKCRLVRLRNLARKYDGLQIAGREISKANKVTLLEELKNYYLKTTD